MQGVEHLWLVFTYKDHRSSPLHNCIGTTVCCLHMQRSPLIICAAIARIVFHGCGSLFKAPLYSSSLQCCAQDIAGAISGLVLRVLGYL